MAETSYLWDNPATGDSPVLGYGNAHLNQVIFRMLYDGTLSQGVILGWLNNLEVTDGGGLNATVDTGASLNYGVWFENDSAATVVLPNNATVIVVVRASWAAQTARLAQIAAPLVQNPGVTYDIPLATVTTLAGVITLIVDARDYCVFSTDLWPGAITSGMIVADAATTVKLIDQDRWFLRGAGALAPDATNPATWTNFAAYSRFMRDEWTFSDAVADTVWCTVRVPTDISGVNITIYLWHTGITPLTSGDTRWTYSIWQAAPGGIAALTAGAVVVTADIQLSGWGYPVYLRQDTLVALAVTGGDVLHIELARDGGHAADTYAGDAIASLYFYYTADS